MGKSSLSLYVLSGMEKARSPKWHVRQLRSRSRRLIVTHTGHHAFCSRPHRAILCGYYMGFRKL